MSVNLRRRVKVNFNVKKTDQDETNETQKAWSVFSLLKLGIDVEPLENYATEYEIPHELLCQIENGDEDSQQSSSSTTVARQMPFRQSRYRTRNSHFHDPTPEPAHESTPPSNECGTSKPFSEMVDEESTVKRNPAMDYFIAHGRFEDDDTDEQLDEDVADRFDPSKNDMARVKRVINYHFEKMSAMIADDKDAIKKAVLVVIMDQKSRRVAAREHKVEMIDLISALTNVYKRLGLMPTGEKPRIYPTFELNLLEVRLEEVEEEIPPEVLAAIAAEINSKTPAKVSKPKLQKPKEQKSETGEEMQEKTITSPQKKKPRKSESGNPFNRSAGDHSTYTRRLGDCVPEYWKDHPDYLTLTRGENNSPSITFNKCKAIETVIIDNGNAKNAAIAYNLNYSTLHNYAHRALVTVASVMGETEMPEKTRELIEKNTPHEEICEIMGVKRAPTLARFNPRADVKPEEHKMEPAPPEEVT